MQTKIKTPQEIDAMRKAGQVLAGVLHELKSFIVPGVNGEQIDSFAETYIRDHGMIPGFKGCYDFPNTVCLCVNAETVHGIPTKTTVVRDGDIVTVDCGVIFQKMNTDAAVTYGIGNVKTETLEFLKTCESALYNGIDQIKPGNHIGDVSYAIEQTVRRKGYHIIEDLGGHGIGQLLHEEPFIPNYGKKGTGQVFKAGQTFAIEPIVGMKTGEIKTLADNWMIVTTDGTLSSQFEHTILVTDSGVEILTLKSDV